MRSWASCALALLLAACAGAPPLRTAPAQLFDDGLFAPPSERITAADVFALSDEMRAYLDTEIAREINVKGRQQALFDALYSKRQLRIEYDAERTRNAAETFAARAGNCLSLVIMTAAFAKKLELPVTYNSAYNEQSWARKDDTQFIIGHVNVTLGARAFEQRLVPRDTGSLTIDFLAPPDLRGMRTRELAENTIVAMYFNNRAAEELVNRHLDNAYSWARAAIEQDPNFTSAYNTLGLVFRRHGNFDRAETVLTFALARDPSNTHIMANLVSVLAASGRMEESKALERKLASIDPNPPFAFFYRGLQAMGVKDYQMARNLFLKEIDRDPYYHEFRYWLAVAYANLGDFEKARRQLALAMEYSPTRGDRDLYAAKLARLAAPTLH